MTKKLVQHPLVSGQLLPLRAQLGVEPPQSNQGLVPDDVVQRTTGRPRRTGSPLVGMIRRCDNLQERLESLPRREQPHLPVAESSTCRDHHYVSPRVAFRPSELLTSWVSAKHTRRVSVKVWVVGLYSSGVCVGRIQRSQQR